MPNGDLALSDGMDVVPITADARQGSDEINKTRDYVATRVRKPADGAGMARREIGSVHSIGFYTTSDAEIWFRPEPTNASFDRRLARAAEVEDLETLVANLTARVAALEAGT